VCTSRDRLAGFRVKRMDRVGALRSTFFEISRTLSGVMSAEEVIRIEHLEMQAREPLGGRVQLVRQTIKTRATDQTRKAASGSSSGRPFRRRNLPKEK
jgi:hypothetical protein